MDAVVAVGALAILLVVAATIGSVVRSRAREREAASALHRTEALGVQPVSLHPVVAVDACIGSGSCVEACPEVDVLGVIGGKAKVVNPTACIGHGECLRACPVNAITLCIGTEKRGVDIPLLAGDFQSNIDGLYIVGELGGMGLIYNAVTQALQCMQAVVKSSPPRAPGVHQVLIVGAGPAGLAATLGAKAAKLDAVTVDQESVGGTVLQYPRHKIVMTRPVTLPLYGKLKITSVAKEDLLATWNDIIERTGIEIRTRVKVDSVRRGDDGVFVAETSAGTLRAQRVVLAMGRRGSPRKLGIPGEELPKVTYRLLEPESYAGKRCLVVGGGDAAVEAAIALGECGAEVRLAYRGDAFSRIKPKNQQRLDQAAQSGTVEVMTRTEPRAIDETTVRIARGGAEETIPNDFVLIFAGGVLPQQFLETAGVRVETFTGQAFAPANA